ncbi:MAG TPA: trypsin-like peptidase domain-containing protein [bacterium]|nr:trypsin-like peptidase domain-containing protein [bacterium]
MSSDPQGPRGVGPRGLAILGVLLVGAAVGAFLGPLYDRVAGPRIAAESPAAAQADPGAPTPGAPPSSNVPGAVPPAIVSPAPPVAPGPRVSEETAIVRVVQTTRPAVVNISVRAQVATPFGVFPQEGQGSGVIVRSDGLILTNNHVVQGAQEITATLLSGRSLRGRVLGADRFSDLAVVKLDGAGTLPVVEMGSSGTLQVGQMAIAIGNPFGLASTVTVGVVSALNRTIQAGPDFVVENLIQTDAAINPGNSGGALLDSSGHLIGINTAIVRDAQGIGFAIPIDLARVIMDQIVAQGKVVRPALGVEIRGEIDPNTARQFNLPVDHGVVVVPTPGGPAEKAGLRAQDIVVAIDGQKIRNISELRRELFRRKPGDRVRVEVVRDGKRQTFTVPLTELRTSMLRWSTA